MATYKEIQQYVKLKYGFTPKTCWIAHMKEMYGELGNGRKKDSHNEKAKKLTLDESAQENHF